MLSTPVSWFFFFFNDTATTEIYTLSLHDALPIFSSPARPSKRRLHGRFPRRGKTLSYARSRGDRKSTRLNSSHSQISYAVFCLKKKTNLDVKRLEARKINGVDAKHQSRTTRDAQA